MAVSPSTRISLPVALSFASTALPIAAIGLVMGVYLPRFFAGHLGLSMVAVGAAITIVRLIDLAVDPLLGMAMDRTTSRWGRYRPWLVVGAAAVRAGGRLVARRGPVNRRLGRCGVPRAGLHGAGLRAVLPADRERVPSHSARYRGVMCPLRSFR